MTTTTTNEELPTPSRYQEASIRFREAWLEYVDKEELVKFEIVNMVKILEKEGYSRTEAIQKIKADHNDLRGFSKATIYRQLPDEMKRKWTPLDEKPSNVSNETLTNVIEDSSTSNESQMTEQEADEILKELPEPTQEHEDDDQTTEIFDKDFVNRLVQENKQLQDENDNLKVLVAATEEPKAYNRNPTRQYSKRGNSFFNPQKTINSSSEPLTQQYKEYVQAHEDEIKRNQQVADLIESLTNKTIAEQGAIIGKTPNGEDFRKKLADESSDYMLKVAKQMTTSEVSVNLWDHRTLRYISERFSDILYEEQEIRKRNEEIGGQ